MERLQALLWITQITVTFYNTRIIFCPKIVDFVGSYNELCCLIAKADFIDRTLQLWPRKQYCRLFFSVIKIWPPPNWIPVYFSPSLTSVLTFELVLFVQCLVKRKCCSFRFQMKLELKQKIESGNVDTRDVCGWNRGRYLSRTRISERS